MSRTMTSVMAGVKDPPSALSEKRGRVYIELHRRGRVALERGGGPPRADLSLQRIAHRRGLAGVGHHAQDPACLHDLADRHRDRPPGHVLQALEPALAELLPAARLVEPHHDVRLLGREIGRRVVEGEVAVLADADEGQVDLAAADQLAHAARLRLRIRPVTLDEMESAGMDAVGEALLQVTAEARRVGRGQAHVLVEMEEDGTPPVDVGSAHELLQELELRRPGRGDHARAALAGDRVSQRGGRLGGGRLAERNLVREDAGLQRALAYELRPANASATSFSRRASAGSVAGSVPGTRTASSGAVGSPAAGPCQTLLPKVVT